MYIAKSPHSLRCLFTVCRAACPFLESSHCQSTKAIALIIQTLETAPSHQECLQYPHITQPHPFRAKLPQNFIIMVLRLISSSEVPSVGEEDKSPFLLMVWFVSSVSISWECSEMQSSLLPYTYCMGICVHRRVRLSVLFKFGLFRTHKWACSLPMSGLPSLLMVICSCLSTQCHNAKPQRFLCLISC